jgi:flagellin FlaB
MHVSAAHLKKKDTTEGQIGIGTLIIFIAMVLVAAVAAAVLIQTSGVLQQDAMSTGREASKEVSSNLQIQQIEGFRSKYTDTNMSSSIDALKLTIGLNAASEPVDINQVVITVSDGYRTNDLVYAGNENTRKGGNITSGKMENFSDTDASSNKLYLFGSATTIDDGSSPYNALKYFTVDKFRDEDNSFSQSNPVMTSGDIIIIYVSTASYESYTINYDYLMDMTLTSPFFLTTPMLDLSPRSTVNLVLTPETGAPSTAEFILPTTFGGNERVALYP